MSEIVSTLHTTPYYTFASPRYNCLRNYPTTLIPEDYEHFDSVNGSADKYFPCYTLTSNQPPVVELVDNKGVKYPLKGNLSFRKHLDKGSFKIVGRKDNPDKPFNQNLARHKVYFTSYVSSKFNPGWCVIQTYNQPPSLPGDKVTYIPQLLVRCLGNNMSVAELYAYDLDSADKGALLISEEGFLPGDIVLYKKHLFKCHVPTKSYPPSQQKDNQFWNVIDLQNNVFNADVFTISKEGAKYYKDATDETRRFDPVKDNQGTLVSWSIAYYSDN